MCMAVFHAIGVTGFIRHDSDSLSSVTLTDPCKKTHKLVQKMFISWYCKDADDSKPCNQRYAKADTGKEYHTCMDGGTKTQGKGGCVDSGNKCDGKLFFGNYKAKFMQAAWWLSTAGNYAGIIKFGLLVAFGAAAVTTPLGAVLLGLTILGMVGAAAGIISGVIALKDSHKMECGTAKTTVGIGLAATGLTTATVVQVVAMMEPTGVASIIQFFLDNKGALGMVASVGGIANRGLTTKDPKNPQGLQHKMSVGVTKAMCDAILSNVHKPVEKGGQGVVMQDPGTDKATPTSSADATGKTALEKVNAAITAEPPQGLDAHCKGCQKKMDVILAMEKLPLKKETKLSYNSLSSPEVEAEIHDVSGFTPEDAELAGFSAAPDELDMEAEWCERCRESM